MLQLALFSKEKEKERSRIAEEAEERSRRAEDAVEVSKLFGRFVNPRKRPNELSKRPNELSKRSKERGKSPNELSKRPKEKPINREEIGMKTWDEVLSDRGDRSRPIRRSIAPSSLPISEV